MYILGIDVGGMSIKGGVINESGEIVYKDTVETKAADHTKIIADIAAMIKRLLDGAKITINDISGIGMGIPGSIDSKRGVIVYSNNINFINVPIAARLKELYPELEVFISNDANAAALGEVRFGEAKAYKNVVFVTLGTGVGTGIIIDGKLFEGNASAGAEGGHTVICSGGEPCSCGRRGCFEAYASAAALTRQTAKALEANPKSKMAEIVKAKCRISARTAFEAVVNYNDETAVRVIDQYIKYVGEGLVNLANIFRPDVILIGGGVSNESGYPLFEKLQQFVDTHAYGMKDGNPRVIVKKASLTNDAGILGAASLVL